MSLPASDRPASTPPWRARHTELLRLVDAGLRERGRSPSYQEMAGRLGIRARSGVHRMVEMLVADGALARGAGRFHSLSPVASHPLVAASVDPWRLQACGRLGADGAVRDFDPTAFRLTLRPALRALGPAPVLPDVVAGDHVLLDRTGRGSVLGLVLSGGVPFVVPDTEGRIADVVGLIRMLSVPDMA